jgi:hypothetical protein
VAISNTVGSGERIALERAEHPAGALLEDLDLVERGAEPQWIEELQLVGEVLPPVGPHHRTSGCQR